MPEERIQKILARAGVASRRAVEDLIRQGRVTVNGQAVELGAQADAARDDIRVDGERISTTDAVRVYIMLNKPRGVISAASSQPQENRRTVRDLVPLEGRLYPVGRLDADSEGLILLTNDGELTQRLTHPRYGHQKTYKVLVTPAPTSEQLERWRKGVELDDGPTAPVELQTRGQTPEGTWLELTMGEGRKRQIRRTAQLLGLHVKHLLRVQLGPLKLTDLAPGAWRHLTDDEVRALKHAASGGGGKRSGGKPATRSRHRGKGARSQSRKSSPTRASRKGHKKP
ncbi:MAG: rRNA pseudouridine synthase [Anaerolineae bacterium]|nr:rRNA pseudouridine synthase [Anaerolineae bacterium]